MMLFNYDQLTITPLFLELNDHIYIEERRDKPFFDSYFIVCNIILGPH